MNEFRFIPGLRAIGNGNWMGGSALLLLFSYAIVTLSIGLWSFAGAQAYPPAAMSALPRPRTLVSSLDGYPGRSQSGASLSIEFGLTGISVNRIDPIVPDSTRIVTRDFVLDLATSIALLTISIIGSKVSEVRQNRRAA